MTDPDPTPGSCWLVVFDVPEKAAARFMAALEPFCVSVAAVRTGKPGLTRIEGIAVEPPPAGLLAAALALAQVPSGVIDEGVLVVRRDSQEVARETFPLRERRPGDPASGWLLDAAARWPGARRS